MVARHRVHIETELNGGEREMTVEGLIAEVVSVLGISASALKEGARGHSYSLARRMLVERAVKLKINLAAVAKGLECPADTLYKLNFRRS